MWEGIKEGKGQWHCSLSRGLHKVKSDMEKRIFYFLILVVFITVIQYGGEKYLEWQEAHSEIPDVVSSRIMNRDYYLLVVANSRRIEDKEEFAREVVHMC